MSNEVANVTDKPVVLQDTAMQSMLDQLEARYQIALRLGRLHSDAGMLPKGLDTIPKAMVAILQGFEVGFSPATSLQVIAVINGKPSIYGDAAIALVEASGQLEEMEETISGDGDKRTATCTVKRKGKGVISRTFSVADAKVAKLWQKKGANGSDTPWITYPDRMLQMRARGFALRDRFADVLKGIGIAEEQHDIELTAISVANAPKPPKVEIEDHSVAVTDAAVEGADTPTVSAKPKRSRSSPKAAEELQASAATNTVEAAQEGAALEAGQPVDKAEETSSNEAAGSAEEASNTSSAQIGEQLQAEIDGFIHKLTLGLDNCDDEDEVEEEWNSWDVGATWEHLPEVVERASEVRRARLAELSPLNAG